jgi:hypothetical protein
LPRELPSNNRAEHYWLRPLSLPPFFALCFRCPPFFAHDSRINFEFFGPRQELVAVATPA